MKLPNTSNKNITITIISIGFLSAILYVAYEKYTKKENE